jgi:hypothetical protein
MRIGISISPTKQITPSPSAPETDPVTLTNPVPSVLLISNYSQYSPIDRFIITRNGAAFFSSTSVDSYNDPEGAPIAAGEYVASVQYQDGPYITYPGSYSTPLVIS